MSITYFPDNKSQEPDLNISNGYAHIPAEMMGVKFTSYFVRIKDLPKALERARVAPLDPHVCSDLHDGNVFRYGRTREQIFHYRKRIVEILEVCIKNNVPLMWG